MSKTLAIYKKLTKLPFGNFIFSQAVSFQAPFFRTIHPLITDFRPGYCRVEIKDRRSIQNHFRTIHAGALCTLSELVGGLTVEATIPNHLRWIPREMTVKYVKKAKGKLVGECELDASLLQPGDVKLPFEIKDQTGQTVLKTEIVFYISERKTK